MKRLRRAGGNTRTPLTIVTADLECGDFAGDERGATSKQESRGLWLHWMSSIRRQK